MLIVKLGGIKYHFSVFGMTRPETEPRSTEQLANTLLIRPGTVYLLDQWPVLLHHIYDAVKHGL